MADAQLQVGDVVRLKSGGPKMTIARFYDSTGGNKIAECIWFEGPTKYDSSFAVVVLEK